ncbi:MAG: hypothetical protein A2V75_09065 [Actinobacteria bacterium RBG_16_70_17]|nr:MAG: hypothetical protein A2V75_09065 [Actinobacteria bacterium RBG_16_70_17]
MTTNPHLETSSLPGMPTITLAMRDCDAGLEDLRARLATEARYSPNDRARSRALVAGRRVHDAIKSLAAAHLAWSGAALNPTQDGHALIV